MVAVGTSHWPYRSRRRGLQAAGSFLRALLPREADDGRLERLATRLGCTPDIESLTAAVLAKIHLGDGGIEPVRSTVEHIVSDRAAWQSMMMGVVPPSVRAKALCGLARTSPTDPGDAAVAAVFSVIREALG